MPKKKPPTPSPSNDPIVVKVVVRNGFVRDLPNLPEGVSVHIYDYDLDKYDKDRLEPDPEGKLCVALIWSRYPNRDGKTVYEIRHTVRIGVRKRKVHVDDCPKQVKVTVIIEK